MPRAKDKPFHDADSEAELSVRAWAGGPLVGCVASDAFEAEKKCNLSPRSNEMLRAGVSGKPVKHVMKCGCRKLGNEATVATIRQTDKSTKAGRGGVSAGIGISFAQEQR